MTFLSTSLEEAGSPRVVLANRKPWYVAIDLLRALEIAHASHLVRGLDAAHRTILDFMDGEGLLHQQVVVVDATGMNSLILQSGRGDAKAFAAAVDRWILRRVYPALGWGPDDDHLDEDDLIAHAVRIAKRAVDAAAGGTTANLRTVAFVGANNEFAI